MKVYIFAWLKLEDKSFLNLTWEEEEDIWEHIHLSTAYIFHRAFNFIFAFYMYNFLSNIIHI